MHYICVLDGLLKGEVINFDSSVTFVLFSDPEQIKSQANDDDSNTTFYLKSEKDITLQVDLKSEKLLIQGSDVPPLWFFEDNGTKQEILKPSSSVELTKNIKKIKFESLGFSFLINGRIDPEIEDVKPLQGTSGVSSLFKKHKLLIYTSCAIFTSVIVGISIYSALPIRENTKVALFDNEVQLMKANLQGYSANDIVVKTYLKSQIENLLDELGIKYIRFDLIPAQSKYNLILYKFTNDKVDDTEVDLNSILIANNIKWVSNVSSVILNPQGMFSDYNNIAAKYNLEKKKLTSNISDYQLINLSMPNNNLKYKSVQRDLAAFYKRWGKNYIEFNVNLEQKKNTPVDFIIQNGQETIIKSGQGYYFN